MNFESYFIVRVLIKELEKVVNFLLCLLLQIEVYLPERSLILTAIIMHVDLPWLGFTKLLFYKPIEGEGMNNINIKCLSIVSTTCEYP